MYERLRLARTLFDGPGHGVGADVAGVLAIHGRAHAIQGALRVDLGTHSQRVHGYYDL